MRDFTFGRLENVPKSAIMQFLYTLPLTKKGDVRKNGKIHIGWFSLDTDRKEADLEGNYTQGILCKNTGNLGRPLKRFQNFEDLIPMYYPFSYDTQYFSKNNQAVHFNTFRLIDNYKAANRFFHDLDYSQILCKKCFDIGSIDYGLDSDNDGWFINPKGAIKLAESFEGEEVKNTIFDKYIDEWDWMRLSENPALTPALIEEYKDKLNWSLLSKNPALTPALIEEYKDKLNWKRLSYNPNLTPAFIEKYKEKLEWDNLSFNPSLTPALIEKYKDKLNWVRLSKNPALTPALIEKNIDNVNWRYLSRNPSLTPALIEKYAWEWEDLSQNPALTPALIEKYKDKVFLKFLCLNPSLTPALIENLLKNPFASVPLSKNPSLTPAIIRKYSDKLEWYSLSKNPALTTSLIDEYIHETNQLIDWESLSENPNISLKAIKTARAAGHPLDMDKLSKNPAIFKSFLNPYEIMLKRRMGLSFDAEDTDLKCSQCGSKSVQKFKDEELGDWEMCVDCGKAVELTDDWVVDIDWDSPPPKEDIYKDIEWEAEQNMEWLESPKWAIGDFEVPAALDDGKRYPRKCRYLKNGPTGYDLLMCKSFFVQKGEYADEINEYSVYVITPSEMKIKTGGLTHKINGIKQLKNAKKQGLDMLKQVIETESILKGQLDTDNPYEVMLRRRLGIKSKEKSPKIKFTVQPIGNEVIIYAESQEFKTIEFLRGELMTLKNQKTGFNPYYFASLKEQITTATYPNDFLKYVADYFVIATKYGEPYYDDSTSVTCFTISQIQLICDTFSDYYTGTEEEKEISKENIPPYITKILDSRKGTSYCEIDMFRGVVNNFDVSGIPCVVLDTYYRMKGNYYNPSWKRILKGDYMLVEFRFGLGRDNATASKFEYTIFGDYVQQNYLPENMVAEMKSMINLIVYNNRKTIRKDISAEEINTALLVAFMDYFAENEKLISEGMNKVNKSATKGYNTWNLELADGSPIEPFIFVGGSGKSVRYEWKHDADEAIIVKNNKFEYVLLPDDD